MIAQRPAAHAALRSQVTVETLVTVPILCSWCYRRSQEDILVEARRLLDAGYYQISRHYQILARLPEGMTAHQALRAAVAKARDLPGCQEPRLPWTDEEWIRLTTDADAGDHYLRGAMHQRKIG